VNLALIRQVYEHMNVFLPKSLRIRKPRAVQFPVNDVCNSRCVMCNIWQQQVDDALTVPEIDRIFSNALFSRVVAVGINGGEPTLRDDLVEIVEVLQRRLKRLRSISVITNGYEAEDVVTKIRSVARQVHCGKQTLDVMVSLDGVGDVHDQVRRREDFFDRASSTLLQLRDSGCVDRLRIGCTIVKENVHGLRDLLTYAKTEGIYIKYRLGVPHQRLYTERLEAPYSLTPEETAYVADFLEELIAGYDPSLLQQFFYRSLIDQLIHGAPRKAGCVWQTEGCTVTAKGELLYCALQSRTLGSAISEDAEHLYFANRSDLKAIWEQKCPSCRHDYVGVPRIWDFALFAVQKMRSRYARPSRGE